MILCETCGYRHANERQARKIHDVCELNADLQKQIDRLAAERDIWRGRCCRMLAHGLQRIGEGL